MFYTATWALLLAVAQLCSDIASFMHVFFTHGQKRFAWLTWENPPLARK